MKSAEKLLEKKSKSIDILKSLEKKITDTEFDSLTTIVEGFYIFSVEILNEFEIYLDILNSKLDRIQKTRNDFVKDKMMKSLDIENANYINQFEVLICEYEVTTNRSIELSFELVDELESQKIEIVEYVRSEIVARLDLNTNGE